LRKVTISVEAAENWRRAREDSASSGEVVQRIAQSAA
jgi:hypothetical protein